MKPYYILFFIFIISCKERRELSIDNQTNKPIYYSYSPNSYLTEANRVGLFLSSKLDETVDTSYTNRIAPKSSTLVPHNASWDEVITKLYGGRINFFFFSVDMLQRYSWEEIMKRNLYAKRQSYTVEELEKLKWIIIYPSNHEIPRVPRLILKK